MNVREAELERRRAHDPEVAGSSPASDIQSRFESPRWKHEMRLLRDMAVAGVKARGLLPARLRRYAIISVGLDRERMRRDGVE